MISHYLGLEGSTVRPSRATVKLRGGSPTAEHARVTVSPRSASTLGSPDTSGGARLDNKNVSPY